MKHLVILAAAGMLVAQFAWADDIYARAAAGRAASETPEGSEFDQSMVPLLGKVGNICDPAGKVLPAAELGQFVLVGDVTPKGVLVHVEVSPRTLVAACFASELAKHRFDPPPRPQGDYPILVQLNVSN